jgi:hypothetical protein
MNSKLASWLAKIFGSKRSIDFERLCLVWSYNAHTIGASVIISRYCQDLLQNAVMNLLQQRNNL